MIPKIIHYCWFGGNPLPELAQKCIYSWKKFCPDYEIIEWNETNFDLSCCEYVKEAAQAKKWAFVTDYVRLFVMVNYGGIYMDTDVEVLKSLNPYLNNHAFSGFENSTMIPTGIMASEKGFPLFLQLLNYYHYRHFIKSDGTYDTTTNVIIITNMCSEHGFVPNDKFQIVDGLALYPHDFFCPKSHDTGEVHLTKNTVTIHHFSGSWLSKSERIGRNIKRWFEKENMLLIGKVIAFPFSFYTKIQKFGIIKTMKWYVHKYIWRK